MSSFVCLLTLWFLCFTWTKTQRGKTNCVVALIGILSYVYLRYLP